MKTYRNDLLVYSLFVYLLGIDTGLMIAFGSATWGVIASMVFISVLVLGGFCAIYTALPKKQG